MNLDTGCVREWAAGLGGDSAPWAAAARIPPELSVTVLAAVALALRQQKAQEAPLIHVLSWKDYGFNLHVRSTSFSGSKTELLPGSVAESRAAVDPKDLKSHLIPNNATCGFEYRRSCCHMLPELPCSAGLVLAK